MPTETETLEKPEVEKPSESTSGAEASSFFERMTLAKAEKKEAKKEKEDEAGEAKPEAKDDGDEAKAAKTSEPTAKAEKAEKSDKPAKSAAKKVTPMVIPPDPVDTSAIAAAAASAAVAAVAKASPQPAARKQADEPKEISEDDQYIMSVLERMEKDRPESYKGHAKKYAESLSKAEKYQNDWQARHPGETFDADADEHDEFFKANEIDWNDVHFNRASTQIETDKAMASITQKEDAKSRVVESENRLLRASPAITMRRAETAKTLFGALGDDYKAVLNEDGSINGAEIKRLQDEDPLREIAFQAANRAEFFAAEIYKVTNRLVEFNEKDPTHKFIADYVAKQEEAMLAMPADDQLNAKGQRFATAEQYAAMTPARRAYFWRFADKDISDLYAESEAASVKTAIAAEEIRAQKVAERRGFKRVEQQPESQATAPQVAVAQATPVEKPVSPAGGVGQRPAQLSGAAAAAGQSKSDSFTSSWLGK